MRWCARVGVVCAVWFSGVGSAWSQDPGVSPSVTSYTGRLVSDGVAAAGTFEVRVTVFDAAAGGAALATRTRTVMINASDGGVFTIDDLDLNDAILSGPRFLEIAVREVAGTFEVLTPRQPVNYAPRARFALEAATGLTDAYARGPSIETGTQPVSIIGQTPRLVLGETLVADGALEIRSLNADGVTGVFSDQTNGSLLEIFNNAGGRVAELGADLTGGELTIRKNEDGDAGIVLDGSFGGTEQPAITVFADPWFFAFNGFSPNGNGALQLSPDAVSAPETLDEAGVASAASTLTIALPDGVATTLLTRTITAPTPGFVIATATANVLGGRGAAESRVWLGVSDAMGVLDLTRASMGLVGPAVAGSFFDDFVLSAQGVFPVDAGATTLYLVGRGDIGAGGGVMMDARSLTLVFVPTAYGAVEPVGAGARVGGAIAAAGRGVGDVRGGLTAAEIRAEQMAEHRRHLAELEATARQLSADLERYREMIDAVDRAADGPARAE